MIAEAGDQLNRYQILAPLGAGGMGEVYRARDSKLERQVAIKLLSEEFIRAEKTNSGVLKPGSKQ